MKRFCNPFCLQRLVANDWMIVRADMQYSAVNWTSLSRVGCRVEHKQSMCGMPSRREEQCGERRQNPYLFLEQSFSERYLPEIMSVWVLAMEEPAVVQRGCAFVSEMNDVDYVPNI